MLADEAAQLASQQEAVTASVIETLWWSLSGENRIGNSPGTHGVWRHEPVPLVCLGKIGPILKRVLRDAREGQDNGTTEIYAGADHRETT